MDTAEIMIVEDEAVVAMDLENKLQTLGFKVSATVPSGEEAIEAALTHQPGLILMDIMLQGEMDGIEAARVLRDVLDVPVIYLTSYSDQNTIERAKTTQPFGYLLKPFRERELLAAIEMAVYKHQADLALKRQQEWLATILRSIGDGVIATDGKGRIQFMNKVAESLTGWTEEEARGKPVPEVFSIVDGVVRKPIECPVDTSLRNGSPAELPEDAVLIDRTGREFAIDDGAAPIKDEKGNLIGVVLAFRDITEKKLLKQGLIQAEKLAALGRMVAGTAHELNNPLTAVIGFTDLLLACPDHDRELRERLQLIRSEGDRARTIIKNFLTFASGEHRLSLAEVDLNAVLQSTIDMRRGECRASGIDIRFERAGAPIVIGDWRQLQQVFLNVILNAEQAIAANGKNGEIVVKTKTVKSDFQPAAVVSIEDSGPGIPQANLTRVFDPFFTTKPVGEGTGLGLSVSYGIVREHKGQIRAENRIGGGARVIVQLPIMSAISLMSKN